MIIEGAIAVKAAIINKKRKVETVYIDKHKKTKDFNFVRKICKEKGIIVYEISEEDLRQIVVGKTSGGICAKVLERQSDELSDGDIFYLDGIEDPFNLGYAMRTLYAFGVNNVVLNKRDYSSMEAQLLKSSAGAYDMLNVKFVDDDLSFVQSIKEKGYYVYALFRDDSAKDIFRELFKDKVLFILGGEKRGIKSEILKQADQFLYISYGSNFRNSLNACAALDVVATLLYKQRTK